FVTVWALLRFTGRVSRVLLPEPMIAPLPGSAAATAGERWRWLADVAAVSLVATATATPMVAAHFGMVNPWGVVLSVLALPVLTAVLGLGYLKIVVGFVLPSGALVLSGPLRWVGTGLSVLVEQAAGWPGATVRLVNPVPGWWAVAALGVTWLWFGGWFAQRRAAGVGAVALLVAVLVWQERSEPDLGLYTRVGSDSGAKTSGGGGELAMLAVGDGSCFVLRSGGKTLVFDCGSQWYPLIGRRSVVPTLRAMGVRRVDVLVVSHADLDHYNGALDVADALPVGEVWVSADVPDEARAHPGRATAFLVDELRRRGVPMSTVARGDRRVLGDATLDVLWPPATGWEASRGNDRSVVVRAEVGGRQVLLSGDVQQDAIAALLESHAEELDADVADLPHHGSFVEASPAWIDAVSPTLVLQSSGPARLRRDRWAGVLADHPGVTRLVSDRVGFTRVRIDRDGTIGWATFLDPAAARTD
ncbi:MAG: MBL fold metallo-hydrolase, partial [Planctomycetota bacterium]